ncbi:hypothetical protein C3B61_03900 [Cryobacterium zongtaii]|uniref:Uncharacterized protein n=1 Tax=Cryobacterium zongtaii TaxID=1259217 RepID=A0A2S3ZL13_9MICO|nr:hypothetical protein [Cryobacterium zongtaii]POH69041.1 hypothetical protein C3B61_03900 [Cryobacterium zongtaii]
MVVGTIGDSVTEGQIRRLTEAATDYLGTAQGDGVEMRLQYGIVSFTIAPTQAETARMLDLALTAATDDRVSFVTVDPEYSYVYGPKSELSTLYRDYSGPDNPPVTVTASGSESQFNIGDGPERCDAPDALVAKFDQLLLDPTAIGIYLELCTMFTVTVADDTARDAIVAEIQPLASDPSYSSVEFSVQTEGEAPVSVTADTPPLDPLVDLSSATPGVAS